MPLEIKQVANLLIDDPGAAARSTSSHLAVEVRLVDVIAGELAQREPLRSGGRERRLVAEPLQGQMACHDQFRALGRGWLSMAS